MPAVEKILKTLYESLTLACIYILALSPSGALAESQSRSHLVVVELFTSEGCSSCPPADRLLQILAKTDGPPLIVLSEHVDYWNYLGWRDPFSDPRFSDRQKQYANVFGQSNVYTPEMVVDGATGFVGTDSAAAKAAIGRAAFHKKNTFNFTAIANAEHRQVDVALISPLPKLLPDEQLIAMLTEDDKTVSVKSGENAGRILNHTSVVREIKTFDRVPPNISLTAPFMKERNNLKVVLILQNMRTMAITGAGVAPVDKLQSR